MMGVTGSGTVTVTKREITNKFFFKKIMHPFNFITVSSDLHTNSCPFLCKLCFYNTFSFLGLYPPLDKKTSNENLKTSKGLFKLQHSTLCM